MIDTGTGPPLLLLHGFPHTPRIWDAVIPALRRTHRVVAPDLVLGGDAMSLADRVANLQDDLGVASADVVAIDAGVPPAFVLALSRPERVRRLVLVESLIGRLPGAESFLSGGAPWWFGFHQVPGLAETVVEGHEREYLGFFLAAGTATAAGRELTSHIIEDVVAAYRGRTALAGAFEHYRSMAETAGQIEEMTRQRRLTVPVLAVGSHPVGGALAAQLAGVADALTSVQLDDCGHIVPLDAPDRFLAAVHPFLADGASAVLD